MWNPLTLLDKGMELLQLGHPRSVQEVDVVLVEGVVAQAVTVQEELGPFEKVDGQGDVQLLKLEQQVSRGLDRRIIGAKL